MASRFGRLSLSLAAAVTLLGLLVAGASWVIPADAQPATPTAQATSAPTTAPTAQATPAPAGDFSQTPPPGQPSAAIADTEYTTRLYGNNPYEEAVAVTRHVYTATQPVTATGELNAAADRPWGVTLCCIRSGRPWYVNR